MPNEYKIVTDSTTDLAQEHANKLGLVIVPYLFKLADKDYYNYLDNRELSSKDFYDALREGKTASTSLVTPDRYLEIFRPILEEGKDIIYLCLSSGLSNSYSQSVVAAEQLKEEYPERTVIPIDSLCASMGQGLLAYYAVKAKESGKPLQEAADYIRDLRLNICHWVMADDLNHLRRGGRVSSTSAFVGSLLNIKPIIHVNNEGRLIPVAKKRGFANVVEHFLNIMDETMVKSDEQMIFISHSDTIESANKMAEEITKRFGKYEIEINPIGPVIGAHTGPGTLALFYLGSKR